MHGEMRSIPVDVGTLFDVPKISGLMSQRPAGQPGYNLIFLAGCQTALNDGHLIANAFGVQKTSADRAYVGFKSILLTFAIDSTLGIDKFCEQVFQNLNLGMTIQEAVDKAKRQFSPHTPGILPNTYSDIRAVVYGDPLTKLKNVYKGESWYRSE